MNTETFKKQSKRILKRVKAYIETKPPAIKGKKGHIQLFDLTTTLIHGFNLDQETTLKLLKSHYNYKCEPPFSEEHLRHKIKSAAEHPPNKQKGWMLKNNRITGINLVESNKVSNNNNTATINSDYVSNIKRFTGVFKCHEKDFIEKSPIIKSLKFEQQGAYFIKTLFHKHEQLNIVYEKEKNIFDWFGLTLSRDEWIKSLPSIDPNTTSGRYIRINAMDGKGIADKNVTSFNYCLLECDNIPLDLQLSFFAKLPLPIISITYSGARSYHAIVKLNTKSYDDYKSTINVIYDRLKIFGIDSANKNPSRLTRLAGTYRGMSQQRLIYLNPKPRMKEIL